MGDGGDPDEVTEWVAGNPLDLEAASAVVDAHGYLSWLGVTVEELGDGRAVLGLPHREELTNWDTGAIHGGATATVVDVASAFAIRTRLDDPMGTMQATTDLNVKYVRPATDDLTVEAEAVRVGSTNGVARVTVESTDDEGVRKPVAIGTCTYRLFTDG